ncbi:MAG TPA: hypothetical protein ENL41_03690, partial [candidate division WOR-3 bacterium]|nr:hypothetical protein [candidate division WOR-3 bacterium]
MNLHKVHKIKKIVLIFLAFVLLVGLSICCSSPKEETPQAKKAKGEISEEKGSPAGASSVNMADSIPQEIWGASGKFGLSFIRIIGEESGESSQAFFYPADVTVDGEGNIYVLDSGNHR